MSYPLRLSTDIAQAMKQLANKHDRSLNNEITQACKAWITLYYQEKKMATINTTQHTQQGITTRYDLQEDHSTVKRTVIAHSDPQVKIGEMPVSSWKWTADGWRGDLSRSNAGYEVAKAFGFINDEVAPE